MPSVASLSILMGGGARSAGRSMAALFIMATPRPPSVCLQAMPLNYASFPDIMPLQYEVFERPRWLDIAVSHGYDIALEYPTIRRIPRACIV
jgi:hypothetical protein